MAFLDNNLINWRITNHNIGKFSDLALGAADVIALKGDFNNDGRSDIALIKTGTYDKSVSKYWGLDVWGSDIPLALSMNHGRWKIIISNDKSFPSNGLPTWVRAEKLSQHFFFTGDFDGNGSTDIAALRPPSIGVALSKPDADWSFAESNSDKWSLYNIYFTGNFDDNKNTTEIALFSTKSNSSTMPVASYTNNGDWQFSNCTSASSAGNFSSWAGEKNVEILTGDFDGDGRTDIALIRKEAGWNTIPVALSRANSSNCHPTSAFHPPPPCLETCNEERDMCAEY